MSPVPYPIVERLKAASLGQAHRFEMYIHFKSMGRLRHYSQVTNIRLGWKGLPRTKRLALYDSVTVKSFITFDPATDDKLKFYNFDQKVGKVKPSNSTTVKR